jgi:O-antigen/teichoic acid export membrane protein
VSLARAFKIQMAGSVVQMFAQIFRGKLAAILLGPAGVGVFNQVTLIWNLFQSAGSMGSFQGMVQHGATAMGEGDRPIRQLLSTFTLVLATVSTLLAITGVLEARFLSDLVLNDGGKHARIISIMLLAVPFSVTALVYRAVLSSARAVEELVRAQILSDVCGAIVFGALIWSIGLTGAVLGFMVSHLAFFFLTLARVWRMFGRSQVRPRFADFSWEIVRRNLSLGASGLMMLILSNVSMMVVTRMIIAHYGLHGAGLFSNAWRLATVYLFSVTAVALSYNLPSLTQTKTPEHLSEQVGITFRFYSWALPALMVGVMAMAEPIIRVILSKEFLPSAQVMFILVPTELLRVYGETLLMPLLARNRGFLFTALYALQTISFVALSPLLLARFGLPGAAIAYTISLALADVVTYLVAARKIGLRLMGPTIAAAAEALVVLAGAATLCFRLDFGWTRLASCAALVLAWGLFALRHEEVRTYLFPVFSKVSKILRAGRRPL